MGEVVIPKKPHLSPSGIDLYTKCGEAWRRRYVEGDKIPPGVAALRGIGVHRGAEVNYKQKVESHKDLTLNQIVEASAAGFDDRLRADGVMLTEEEESTGRDKIVGAAKDTTVSLAALLATEVAPKVQPIAVETTQLLVLNNASHDLLGIMDVVDDQQWVRDIKTGAKTKSQSDWDSSIQFTVYALLYKAKYGHLPKGIKVDQLVALKSGAKYMPAETTRGPADFHPLVNRINVVLDGINAAVFTPATPGAWWCGPRWCGYWRTCGYVNSERKAAAIE